jgi:hypothetical protein
MHNLKTGFNPPSLPVSTIHYVLEGEAVRDEDERGIVFMALNASIFRQFEFMQQQWMDTATMRTRATTRISSLAITKEKQVHGAGDRGPRSIVPSAAACRTSWNCAVEITSSCPV